MMYSSRSTWISVQCCCASCQPYSPTSPGRRLTCWALPFSDSPPKQSVSYRVTGMIVGKGRRWSSRQEEIPSFSLQKHGNTALKAQGQLINGNRGLAVWSFNTEIIWDWYKTNWSADLQPFLVFKDCFRCQNLPKDPFISWNREALY